LDTLQAESKKKAQRFLGKIWSARDVVDNTGQLIKSGILFCENLRVQESLDKLDGISAFDFDSLKEAFELVTSLEATQYHQVIIARVKVIQAFQKITSQNEKEKVLQQYVAKHLWLLNPSWDVVPTIGATQVEKTLGELAVRLKGTGNDEEKSGRLDIFYSRTSNTHVIIELKRYSATPTRGMLIDQVGRYRTEVRTILDSAGRTSETIEVYVLLGKHPGRNTEQRDVIDRQLEADNAKIVLYDELIDNAQELHRGYLDIALNSQKLQTILASVDAEANALIR
jgi:hypothetical protein